MNFSKSPNPSPLDEAKALNKAAALCVKQEMCVSQIRTKLDRWLVEPEAQERIIDDEEAERLISEIVTGCIRDITPRVAMRRAAHA